MWYIDWLNQNDGKGCPFHKARMDIADLYPSILVVLDEYRNWLFDTILSLFKDLEIRDPKILTHLFINLLDGVINGSVYKYDTIEHQKTWSYINTLIELEKIKT